MKLDHRAEIDGLRALAIVPVVLYHAGFSSLPGGFVGVDIFFVISGYLISRIIINEISDGTFTFLGFYERRIRRIIPALFLVIIASIVTVLLVGLPSHLEDTAASSIAAILSVSNFHFWSQSGYFAPSAELMPLLHTWSLGVEEQFYFLFPIVLFVCVKFKIQIRWMLLIGIVPLFAFSVWLSYNKPSVAFYLLPSRAWELAMGALLAAHAIPRSRNRILREVLAALGLALVYFAIIFLDSRVPFPGYAALLPCIGAFLIIQFARGGVAVQRILSLKPVVFIGLISYSLYLWHWPVLAFMRMYFADIHLPVGTSISAAIMSFIFAAVTWRFVEAPFRSRARVTGTGLVKALGASSVVLIGSSLVVVASDGLPGRLSPAAAKMLAAADDIDPLRSECSNFLSTGRSEECRFGKPSPPSFVLVGDSHAAAMRPAFDTVNLTGNSSGTLWWKGACPLLVGARVTPRIDNDACTAFKEKVLTELASSPEIADVILVGRWVPALSGIAPEIGGSYRTFLTDDESTEISQRESERVFERSAARAISAITAMGKRVVIIGGVPEPGFDVPKILALAQHNSAASITTMPREVVQEKNKMVDDIFQRIAESAPNVDYVKIWDIFCPQDCDLVRNGVPLYYDDDHLTYGAAAKIVGPALLDRFSPQHAMRRTMARSLKG